MFIRLFANDFFCAKFLHYVWVVVVFRQLHQSTLAIQLDSHLINFIFLSTLFYVPLQYLLFTSEAKNPLCLLTCKTYM